MVLNDKLGRKHSIMISVIPSTAGFLMITTAHKVWLLLLGRILTGVAGGITASSIPVGTLMYDEMHFLSQIPVCV